MERLSEAQRSRIILSLNCGSSSLKFAAYRFTQSDVTLLCEGEAEEIGGTHSSFWLKGADQDKKRTRAVPSVGHAAAARYALQALREFGVPPAGAVGHRFVHGGRDLREHRQITPELLTQLHAAVDFAPLHLPPALATLASVQQLLPETPQVACFDTAFHRTLADVSKTYALPEEVRGMGVERYGFHGLSLESIIGQLRQVPERLVIAHLGNGSSVTAVNSGRSIDTSMGLTPTGGVLMGTRCGDLDPGVMIYLMRHGYSDPLRLEELFDKRSGLLGLSEKTSDVRELLSLRHTDANAALALRMFVYQVRKAIAGMAAAMNGLDALVLTGGIGEHAAELTQEICSGLEFLGGFQRLVLPSQEDLQIARITAGLLD